MVENKKEKRVPNLRFEGFTDDWMHRPLSTVASIVGGGTPSTKESKYWGGDINWFTPSEIGNSVYTENSTRKITELGLKKSSAKILPKNQTILFTSRAGIGETAILNKEASTNQGFQSIIVNEKNDVYFLYSMTNILKREAMRKASGSTFLEISATEMKKIHIHIPAVSEQNKIGKLLQTIDKIITLEQGKIDIIFDVRQFILRGMYSNNNEVKNYKLDNFTSRKGKKNKNNKKYVVSSVNNKKGFVNQNEQFENTRLDNLDKSTYRIVNQAEFAYNPSRVNVGSIGYNNTSDKLIISPLYVVFALDSKVNDEYFYYYTKTELFLYEVSRNTEGSVRKNLSFNNLGNINLPIPINYRDQLFVTNFFKKLDSLIENIKQKIHKQKEIKEYLLQNLFV